MLEINLLIKAVKNLREKKIYFEFEKDLHLLQNCCMMIHVHVTCVLCAIRETLR